MVPQEMSAEELKAALAEMQIKGAAALKFKRALKASPTVRIAAPDLGARFPTHGMGVRRAAAKQAAAEEEAAEEAAGEAAAAVAAGSPRRRHTPSRSPLPRPSPSPSRSPSRRPSRLLRRSRRRRRSRPAPARSAVPSP